MKLSLKIYIFEHFLDGIDYSLDFSLDCTTKANLAEYVFDFSHQILMSKNADERLRQMLLRE